MVSNTCNSEMIIGKGIVIKEVYHPNFIIIGASLSEPHTGGTACIP